MGDPRLDTSMDDHGASAHLGAQVNRPSDEPCSVRSQRGLDLLDRLLV